MVTADDIVTLNIDPFKQITMFTDATVIKIINAVGFYDKLVANMTWAHAAEHCESVGKRLCTETEYCPHGKGHPPRPGIQIGESWVPVSDESNQWLFVGSDMQKTCTNHRNLLGFPPAWGTTAEMKTFKGNVYCCDSRMASLASQYPSWEDAVKYCQTNKKRVCMQQEYCPNGPGKPPAGGLVFQSEWAPIFDNINGWVAVGHLMDKSKVCHTFNDLARIDPSWGLPKDESQPDAGPKRGNVLCCDDTFISLPGTTNYLEAKQYCESNPNGRLCALAEVCPSGPDRQPRGGARPGGEAWTPVVDDVNQWVGVGNLMPGSMCRTFQSVNKRSPPWGLNKGTQGFLQCCTGPSPVQKKTVKVQATGAGQAVPVVANPPPPQSAADIFKTNQAKRGLTVDQREEAHRLRMAKLKKEKRQYVQQERKNKRVKSLQQGASDQELQLMNAERERKRAASAQAAERHAAATKIFAAKEKAQEAKAEQEHPQPAPYTEVEELERRMQEENKLEQDRISWQQQQLDQLPREPVKVSGQAFGGSTTLNVGANPIGATAFSDKPPPAPARPQAPRRYTKQNPSTEPTQQTQAMPEQPVAVATNVAFDVPDEEVVEANEGKLVPKCVCVELPCGC